MLATCVQSVSSHVGYVGMSDSQHECPTCAGVQSGGAIGMWQSYFGRELLSYHGVDVNYLCKEVFDGLPGVDITIGDQVRALHACPVTASASAADGSLAVLTSRAVLTAGSHAQTLAHLLPASSDLLAKGWEPRIGRIHPADAAIVVMQANRTFWAEYVKRIPQLDIVLDDGTRTVRLPAIVGRRCCYCLTGVQSPCLSAGGHKMDQQIATFESLYPHMAPDGEPTLHIPQWCWQYGSTGAVCVMRARHLRAPAVVAG